MGKLAANKQLKKEALFNTAFELFTTKGINKTTISDIVQRAGVAKGTFYLYFADKYDVRNKLVTKKAGELLIKAELRLTETDITDLEGSISFIVDYIIDVFQKDTSLLAFIAKNLSWGAFRAALDTPISEPEKGVNFYEAFQRLIADSGEAFDNPEIMLFTILELVGGSCYSCILFNEPISMEEYRPYLHKTIGSVIRQHRIS